MAESIPTILEVKNIPTGEIVAVNVSAEDYMEHYAGDGYEWVRGIVIKMSPIHAAHDLLTAYLRQLFDAYLALNPIAQVRAEPFVMRIDAVSSRREPDLQIILNDNPGELTDTAMIGAADICIEVVSPESVSRDHGEKLEEYQKGGVREYWIIDPARRECRLYRLNEEGIYISQKSDVHENYQTPLLPKFVLHIPNLWKTPLPNFYEIADAVRAMFEIDAG